MKRWIGACAAAAMLCGADGLVADDERPQPELAVVARLTNLGNPSPDCGDMHLAVVMKYEIAKVRSGTHPEATLYVVHGCPELPRKNYEAEAGTVTSFKVGDMHELSLTTHGPFLNGEANDAFASEIGQRYWALRSDSVAP